MKRLVFICVVWLGMGKAMSQAILFSPLTVADGLSDNYIVSFTLDQRGLFWIGTSDGLNIYDGYDVTTIHASSVSGLPSDTIRQVFCDNRNRMWVKTPSRLVLSDPTKKFHPVEIPDRAKLGALPVSECSTLGILVLTNEGYYRFDEPAQKLVKVDWLSSLIPGKDFNTVRPFTPDTGIYTYPAKIVLVDYKRQQIIFQRMTERAALACYYDEERIAIATRTGQVYITNIKTGKDERTFQFYRETDKIRPYPIIMDMVKLANGDLALGSLSFGLSIIDSLTGEVTRYTHNPIEPSSIISDNLYCLLTGPNGELILGSNTSGLSIANVLNAKASYHKIFRNKEGEIYDGHSNELAESADGSIWIGGKDRLIKWNTQTNLSEFYYLFHADSVLGSKNLEIRTIDITKDNVIYVGALDAGVARFDPVNGKFKVLTPPSSAYPSIDDKYVNDLMMDQRGQIWVGTYDGLYMIDSSTGKIRACEEDPVLNVFKETVIISFCESEDGRIWIGAHRKGVFCYNPKTKTIENFTKQNGLLTNSSGSLSRDRKGNIFTTHQNGFSVIGPDNRIRHYSEENGLPYPRCESVVVDHNDQVWIANNKCLLKYNPVDGKLEYFKENTGIVPDGFRFDSRTLAKDGTVFFGTQKGILSFDPAMLGKFISPLQVFIDKVILPDSTYVIDSTSHIRTSYSQNSIEFHFALVNLQGSDRADYQYMLEGFDRDWQTGNSARSIRYASLPTGKFTFRLKGSLDLLHWTDSATSISVTVVPPVWKRWWFILLCVVTSALAITGIMQFRVRQVRRQEKLKAQFNKQMAETEMKALRAQMNPHFIFNSLNSINKYILKSDTINASKYLTRFAKLIRLILENSNHKEVALSDELEALRLYIEMEALRFTNKFHYEINVDPGIHPDSILVPPLIVQPYVENAIWHGLLHKSEGGKLSISIHKTEDQVLSFVIEDNGVGRVKAEELKSKSATNKKSLGMKITEDRLNALNQYESLNARIEIIDMKDDQDLASGTKVIISIPV